MHGRLASAVLAKLRKEGIEHVLLPLNRSIATKDGSQVLPKDPINFQGVRLDGVLAIDNLSELEERGAGGASHILAHVTHGPLFESSLLLALLYDGGIVLDELAVVEKLESLGSEVERDGSAQGWG